MARALISSIRSLTGKLVEALQKPEPESSSIASQNNRIRLELEHLHRTLRRIQAVIQDAEDREIRDKSVEIWLSDLRGVAHEAEDVLDEYQYELMKFALEGRDGGASETSNKGNKRKMEMISMLSSFASFSSSSSSAFGITDDISFPAFPVGVADRIKVIKEKFQEIFEAREKFSLREEDGERRFHGARKRPPSTSLVNENGVIGREEDKEKVIDLLNSQNSSFIVIPIVGMGGVGKTTLAQLIYNDPRVCRLFDQRAWVSVSDDFDVIRLTREIIESITEKNCNVSQPNKLQEDLMEKLQGRKFLLVLDDVWNEERNLWEHFTTVFKSAKMVRILTTSRSTFAAQIMQTVPPYHLDSLLEDQSWILFKNCAFGTHNPIEQSGLVAIGEKIVRKCGGLPLAIKALGGVLQYETDRERWNEVLRGYIWELDAGRKEIMSALILSYYMMPSHLRPCFLYFSMFPKEREFQRDQVVRLWMAQGYIDPHSNKRMEDVGRKYFDELYGRSLLLSFTKYGESVYKMHAMIHELAASFSSKICSGISYGVHHLYTGGNTVLSDFLSVNNPRALRTLLNHRLDAYSNNSFVISLASCLRVLDVDLYGAELPDSIGNLKHLRYLCVAGHNMRRLPESLCSLYNLQTLDLQNCYVVLELPRGIGKLINLRFLRLCSREIRKLPDSICLLQNLQILDLKCCYQLSELPSGIEQLVSLRYLDICHSEIKSMKPEIGRLTNLENLQAILHVKGDDNHMGLGEVKDLINLRGTLSISGLENVVDAGYSRNAHMISKHNLKNVKLGWKVNPKLENIYFTEGDEVEGVLYLKVSSSSSLDVMDSEEIEEAVLESLQPSSNVMKLAIYGYNGLKFPGWFGDPCSLAKVSTLVLEDTNVGNDNLSCLSKLPSLKYLYLINFGIEVFGDSDENTRNCEEHRFLSLETLECRYMKRWERFSVVNGDFPRLRKLLVEHCPSLLELRTSSFPSLSSLYISECKSLQIVQLYNQYFNNNAYGIKSIVIKHCPASLHELVLRGFNELQQLEIINCGFSIISLPIKSMVQGVHIAHCRYLGSIIHIENMNLFTDLRLTSCPLLNLPAIMSIPDKFQIVDCPRLKRWCLKHELNYFENVSPLKVLSISNDRGIPFVQYGHNSMCLEFICTKPYLVGQPQESNEFISYHFCTVTGQYLPHGTNFPRITTLQLFNCKKVVSIDGLNNLSNLERLTIGNCPEICHLRGEFLPSTLESLIVKDCDNLCSIASFRSSNALKVLEIRDCPEICHLQGEFLPDTLESLVLKECDKLYSIPSFKYSNALKVLEIWDCPEICHLQGEFFPYTLESLVLKCDKLCSIPSFKYSNALKEVQLWNCMKLTAIMDMHCLISLKTLMVIQCRELCISPVEIFQAKLEDVVIRDCPMMREWCQINNIPYIQWFNYVPNKEEYAQCLHIRRRQTGLMIKETGVQELLQAQRQLMSLMINETKEQKHS
ncbi:hypothetical protein LUZ60_008259 [Juncus effusus]|nr:hypothetical protein LUZ60_008259 [Juncus effusus]